MTREEWRAESVARIGAAVQKIRRGAGMSQEELAARIGSTRNAIQNMEAPKGRKSTFDVLDLIEIGKALDAPPLLLLFPDLPMTAVEYAYGDDLLTWKAHRRFAGMTSNPLTASDGVQLTLLVQLYAERTEQSIPLLIRHRNRPDDPELKSAAEAVRIELAEIEARIAQIRNRLMHDGG